MKNDLATFVGLQREYEKILAHNQRLIDAIDISDKAKIYRDGFECARDMVRSFKMHTTWGPKDTPEFALQYGIEAVKNIFDKTSFPAIEKYNNRVETLENQVEEYRSLLREVFNLFKIDNIAKEDLNRFLELESRVEAKLQFPLLSTDSEHLSFDEDEGED